MKSEKITMFGVVTQVNALAISMDIQNILDRGRGIQRGLKRVLERMFSPFATCSDDIEYSHIRIMFDLDTEDFFDLLSSASLGKISVDEFNYRGIRYALETYRYLLDYGFGLEPLFPINADLLDVLVVKHEKGVLYPIVTIEAPKKADLALMSSKDIKVFLATLKEAIWYVRAGAQPFRESGGLPSDRDRIAQDKRVLMNDLLNDPRLSSIIEENILLKCYLLENKWLGSKRNDC